MSPGIELVAGAVLGVAFQKLSEAAKKAKGRSSDFTSALDCLEKRIKLLTPKIEEVDQLNKLLEDYPREEICEFLQLLEKATDLVSRCSETPRWKWYKKYKYQKRLRELDSSLEKLSKVELQTAQAFDIQRVLLEVIQMNKKLDKIDLYDQDSSSLKWIESETHFGTGLRSRKN